MIIEDLKNYAVVRWGKPPDTPPIQYSPNLLFATARHVIGRGVGMSDISHMDDYRDWQGGRNIMGSFGTICTADIARIV